MVTLTSRIRYLCQEMTTQYLIPAYIIACPLLFGYCIHVARVPSLLQVAFISFTQAIVAAVYAATEFSFELGTDHHFHCGLHVIQSRKTIVQLSVT
jgi:hypothetical protein